MTTTITPIAGRRVNYTAHLLSDFHHGAGSQGNTSLLRTKPIAQPDGTIANVPFLSGASIRHGLRDALAWHLARTLDLQPGSLTKAAVDLLWTGGAVTKTGAETDLGMARRVEEHLPALAMLGYAAQSDIVSGTLRASDAVLVCAETAELTPQSRTSLRRAAAYRGEKFGTRHDVASSPVGRLVAIADDLVGTSVATTQMIFDTQTLISGADMSGHITLTPAATETHTRVLDAAITLWAPNGLVYLGGKTAQGYGHAAIAYDTPVDSQAVEWWGQHILDHAAEILALVQDLTA